MAKQLGNLTKNWNAARQAIADKKLDEAVDYLDTGIAYLAMHSMNGVTDKELIEGVKKEVWYERFWIAIENNIWPTYPDYEKNWKATS